MSSSEQLPLFPPQLKRHAINCEGTSSTSGLNEAAARTTFHPSHETEKEREIRKTKQLTEGDKLISESTADAAELSVGLDRLSRWRRRGER